MDTNDIMPKVIMKKADIQFNPNQPKKVSMFDPDVLKSAFTKKKTMASLIIFTSLCILFAILVFTEEIEKVVGITLSILSACVVVGTYWFSLRPHLKYARAAKMYAP